MRATPLSSTPARATPPRSEADLPWLARGGGAAVAMACAAMMILLGVARLALGRGADAVPTIVLGTLFLGIQLALWRLRRRGLDLVADRHAPEVRRTMGVTSGAVALVALAGAASAASTGSSLAAVVLGVCGVAALVPVVPAIVDPAGPRTRTRARRVGH